MDKQIAQLQNHIIVCGCGRVGLQVVHELQEKKIPFVVVDKDESILEKEKLYMYMEMQQKTKCYNMLGFQRQLV